MKNCVLFMACFLAVGASINAIPGFVHRITLDDRVLLFDALHASMENVVEAMRGDIGQYGEPSIVNLSYRGNYVNDRVLPQLVDYLINLRQLQLISFARNRITNDGLIADVKRLLEKDSVRQVVLAQNSVTMDGIRSLVTALSRQHGGEVLPYLDKLIWVIPEWLDSVESNGLVPPRHVDLHRTFYASPEWQYLQRIEEAQDD